MSELMELKLKLAKLSHLIRNNPEAATTIDSMIRSYEQQGAFSNVTFGEPETEY